eukprot:CAMPEP_0196757060 /NCGR_PEP_ID=MMETSP1091-20130531/103132_1 /TAXON_ID=302021 /ORGANISM="Rhodomonas sp., Strain CCMP768" /LENGTH=101 /DNA_ID=CAMNT_0042105787 /DNA_START=50 /DNA_END=351 /DNA_ORIENTATION=-
MPLNPNAPAFSFNAGAPSFVPGQAFVPSSTPPSDPAAPAATANGLAKLKTDAPTFVPGGAAFVPESSKPAPTSETKQDNAQAKAQDATGGAAPAAGKSWAS